MQDQISENKRADKKIGGLYIPGDIFFSTELTLTEKHIYCYVLAFHTNGITCFQTTETIANRLNLNHSMVRRCISRMDKLGYLERRKIRGQIHTLCHKLTIEGLETNVTESNSECYDLKHRVLQNETHSIISNNTSNNNYNNTTEDRIDPPLSESETPITSDTPSVAKQVKTPSPKVAAKGVPCPDHDDESLKVRMPLIEWEKFYGHVGVECAMWWCAQLEEYATTNPKKFQAYKSHWKTLQKWHQMRCAENLVFGWTPQGGYGFYKPWVNGLKIGGKNGQA